MDYLSRHLAGLPRRLNVAPQLDSIGFIPEKRDIVDRIFPSWNFSFVLAGEGFYELGGVRHKVRAPAVLTQWPGEPMHYGPDSAWREIFLIYPENCGEKLRELGLMRENRPFWQVGNPHRLFEPVPAVRLGRGGGEARNFPHNVPALFSGLPQSAGGGVPAERPDRPGAAAADRNDAAGRGDRPAVRIRGPVLLFAPVPAGKRRDGERLSRP